MKSWVLGCAFLIAFPLSVLVLNAPEECPAGKAFRLTAAVTPVVGQSPLWVTTGRGPIVWTGPETAVRLLWVRDRSAPGLAVISGRHRASGAKARFARAGSTLGLRDEKFQLDAMGTKPGSATPADLAKYSFHSSDAWFSEAGCYEITGRVGRQQSTIYLKIDKRSGT